MLSWTYTTYKVQGLSVDSAVVSFDLFKQKKFKLWTDVCCPE